MQSILDLLYSKSFKELLDMVNAAVAMSVVIYLIGIAAKLRKDSSHYYRCSLVFLAIVMLGYALWPLFGEWPDIMDTLVVVAIGQYLLADRRIRKHMRDRRREVAH